MKARFTRSTIFAALFALLLTPTLWGDELTAPDEVTADSDGCFFYIIEFVVDPGPTAIESFDFTGDNVLLDGSPLIVSNCAFVLLAGGVFGTAGVGCLIDDTQLGTVTANMTTCAGDVFEVVTTILPEGGAADRFIRGDADGNGDVVGLIDGFFILNFGFNGGAAPECVEACDADGSGAFVPLVDQPIVASGRVEPLWYVREQSLSVDYHRYGNLGRRAGEIRRPVD